MSPTRYNAKIELVGGGELPFNEAGKAAYAKNIAGLKDGTHQGRGPQALRARRAAARLGHALPVRNRPRAARQRHHPVRAQSPDPRDPDEQADARLQTAHQLPVLQRPFHRSLRWRHAGGRERGLQGKDLRRCHRRSAERRDAHVRAHPQDEPDAARSRHHRQATPSTTRGIGRRALSTICATTCGSRTMSAANSTATFLRCRACAGRNRSSARSRASERQRRENIPMSASIDGHRNRISCRTLWLGTLALSASVAGWTSRRFCASHAEREDSRAGLEHLRVAHHPTRMARPRRPDCGARSQPDPNHRQHMNQDGAGQVTVRLGNWRDPVLKPWAAEQMRRSNEEVLVRQARASVRRPGHLPPRRRSRATALSGGAVLFHPDAEGRLHDLAARPDGAPHLYDRQAFAES